MFGYNLRPQIWRKMPRRLAQRLSAGFQAKESKPQVTFVLMLYLFKVRCNAVGMLNSPLPVRALWLSLSDEVWSEKMLKWLKAVNAYKFSL